MPFPSVPFFILSPPMTDSNFRNSFDTIFLASLPPHWSFGHTSARDDHEQECGDSSESYGNVSFSKARMRGGDREVIKGGGKPRVHIPDVQRSLQERRWCWPVLSLSREGKGHFVRSLQIAVSLVKEVFISFVRMEVNPAISLTSF